MSRNKSNNKAAKRLANMKANNAKHKAFQADLKEKSLAKVTARQRIFQRYIIRLELERGIHEDATLLRTLPCCTQADIEEIRKDGLNLESMRAEFHQSEEDKEVSFQEWLAEQGH